MSENLDLYGDLGTEHALQPKESYEEVTEQLRKKTAHCGRLESQIQTVEKEAKIASMQNVALKRNISCLYKTAKAELDRKDAEIQRLRQQLAARGGGSRRSK